MIRWLTSQRAYPLMTSGGSFWETCLQGSCLSIQSQFQILILFLSGAVGAADVGIPTVITGYIPRFLQWTIVLGTVVLSWLRKVGVSQTKRLRRIRRRRSSSPHRVEEARRTRTWPTQPRAMLAVAVAQFLARCLHPCGALATPGCGQRRARGLDRGSPS
jgi:hypothetical protein